MHAGLMNTVRVQAVKTHGPHAAALSWLLLGVWLAYSAAMLWHFEVNSAGATAMCRYVAPQ
jgi:hypothetical protein